MNKTQPKKHAGTGPGDEEGTTAGAPTAAVAAVPSVPAAPATGSQGMPVIDDFEALVDTVIAHERVFVRYSRGPEADGPKSMDYEADVELPGLSVTNLTPEPWWQRPCADWVARRVCKYAELSDGRPEQRPWVLVGRVVGNGPDHEPLVVDVQGIGWIGPRAVQEAQQRYRRVFKAGRGPGEADKEGTAR